MPLPSVEAPTPEAAVAAARERYGNAVRVVGVRRIRSGGVLGFFATERFVAEVEDVEPARPRPASKSESARRIEAALSRDPGPLADTGAFLRATGMHRSRPAAARPTARPARGLPDPVDEAAGLLGGGAGPDVDLYSRTAFAAARQPSSGTTAFRPAAAPRTAPHRTAASSPAAAAAAPVTPRRAPKAAPRPPATPAEPAGPSLFTAALAQVVAGDREVREAVDDAVRTAAATSAAEALRALTEAAAASVPLVDEAPFPAEPVSDERVSDGPAYDEPVSRSVLRTPAPAPAAPAMPLAAALAAAMAAPVPAATPAPAAAVPAPAPAPADAVPAPAAVPVVAEVAEPIAVEEVAVEPVTAPVVEPVAPAVETVAVEAAVDEPVLEEPVLQEDTGGEDTGGEDALGVDMWAEPVPVSRPSAAPAAAPVAVAEPVVEILSEESAEEGVDEDEESLLTELLGTAEDEHEPAVAEPVAEPAVAIAEPVAEPTTDVLPAVVVEPIEVPAPQPVAAGWPDAETGPSTGREEAIAEVLRAALAHDTPDDALTDILRGVLASASTHGGVHRGRPPVPATARRMDREPAWVEASAESDEWEVEEAAEAGTEVVALAATASDPAPLPLDATAVLPPLSLLPPPTPGAELAVPRLLGRPPVPPARRLPPVPGRAVARVAAPLATVTRLPVESRGGWSGGRVVVSSVRERGAVGPSGRELVDPRMVEAAGIVSRLRALGVPEDVLGGGFAADVAAGGTYAALTRALRGLPVAPAAPSGAGEVLLVVGPGVETLAAARSLSVSMRLDPDRLQWATRGDLAALVPEASRVTSVDTALVRRQEAALAGTPTVVAVDAPMRAGGRTWLEQVMAVFSPVAVWAVVEATRKPEDVGPWLDGLPRVDALVVQDTDLTADPAAVLGRSAVPVALLDGVRATAHRWASLLCERLETAGA